MNKQCSRETKFYPGWLHLVIWYSHVTSHFPGWATSCKKAAYSTGSPSDRGKDARHAENDFLPSKTGTPGGIRTHDPGSEVYQQACFLLTLKLICCFLPECLITSFVRKLPFHISSFVIIR
jgi:hypothetical protein